MEISGKTKIMFILADPVAHIRCSIVLTRELRAMGHDIAISPLHVKSADLERTVQAIRGFQNVVGFGITIPHKIAVASLIDELLPQAKLVGSVNFVRRNAGGTLTGDNIDGAGFVDGAKESGIDFKGKRVSLGLRSQSDWGVFPRLILEHAYGITPENTDIRHLTPAALTQQLIDGTTDVAVTVFGMEPNMKEWMIGGPLRQLEASGKPLRYLGVDKEAIDRVNNKFGTTFIHTVIPAGTLPKQTEPLPVGLVRGYKAAHPDFSDEAAYQIVMGVAKLAPKLRDLHILWKIWSPELMLAGLSDENVHPGAKKAYVELGWWDKTRNYPAMTYPK